MASQANRFLVDGNLVRIDGSLLQNAPLVNVRVLQDLLHFLRQPGSVFRERHRASGLDFFDEAKHCFRAASEVSFQRHTFCRAHGGIFLKCL